MLREVMEGDLQETTERIAPIQEERKYQVGQLRTTEVLAVLPQERLVKVETAPVGPQAAAAAAAVIMAAAAAVTIMAVAEDLPILEALTEGQQPRASKTVTVKFSFLGMRKGVPRH
jgi:hypothetical protein